MVIDITNSIAKRLAEIVSSYNSITVPESLKELKIYTLEKSTVLM